MVHFCWRLVAGIRTCSKINHQQIRLIFSTLFMDFSKSRLTNQPSCFQVLSRTPHALDLVHIFISCLKRQTMTRCLLCLIFRTEWSSPCRPSITFYFTILKASCPLLFWKAFIMTRSMICLGWARPCSWQLLVMDFVHLSNSKVMLLVKSWKVIQLTCLRISRSIMISTTRWISNPMSIRPTRKRI